jgi:hypothetical protein
MRIEKTRHHEERLAFAVQVMRVGPQPAHGLTAKIAIVVIALILGAVFVAIEIKKIDAVGFQR